MQFKVGMDIVHLSHGIGVITALEEREFSPDKKAKFYIVEIQDQGAPKKVFVPFEHADTKLRPILKSFDEVWVALKAAQTAPIDHQTWNRRYREYMERIGTGQATEIATVLASLVQLRVEKDLSFGERKLLDHAMGLIARELSVCEGITLQDAEAKLAQALNTVY